MYPCTPIVATVVALCVSLGACTKATDDTATAAPAAPTAATPNGADPVSLVQRSGAFDSKISTVAGEVKYLDNKLTLGSRSLVEEDDVISGVDAVFDAPGQTTLMLSVGGMGASCPSLYMFLTLKSDGSTSKTDHFGTCSDGPGVSIENNQVFVTMLQMNGRGDETWTYANDTLSKKSSVQVANAEPPATFDFKEGEPVRIRGTLVNGVYGWTLKLPKQLILTGGEGSGCKGLYQKEIRLGESTLKDAANVMGERDFDVRIQCPGSRPSAFIADLALPGALPVSAPDSAPTGATTLPAGTVVLTKIGGVMCGDLHAMKAFMDTSVPGECVVAKASRRTRVLNTQTNIPGWVFIYINDSTAALMRISDLVVAESAAAPATAPRVEPSRGQSVAEGATICTDLRAMNRAVALQRAGHVAGLPEECLLAPRTLPVRVLGASPMPGIVVVQVGTHQAFVKSEDVTIQ
jgi:hypothetical protein